jgi:hypothetical protein
MAMPTKNIAASNTAIAPSFGGGVSLRICLSKSSRSCRSIFDVPIFVRAKRDNTVTVPLTADGTNIGVPLSVGQSAANGGIGHQISKR